ncbi:dihydrodipicolinate synthase family protein [Caldinitratiruptor microaerophilus]|uniref:4-hydroxy-tetrahydrodipicolinate synthase n=1 Tax=Caldinitratiruptor microaerophilus TaxID=671077 RepID=A0AA35CKV9_9FIRM|nr:dihydrodipicolinate synthase family protein [Caldinitratiruptor microaerophilus]BDG59185.1 4-hydroxy-tetrahydrodipicolinate synthase [Caldinitratiruptor microaerophilus]
MWKRMVIRGIGVVVATPLRPDGSINEQEYRRLLRWLIQSGVGYVQPSAATGQVMQTTDEEYMRLLEIAVEECKGTGTLVTAYPGRADTAHTIRLTQYAQKVGADAYFLVQPLFSRPDAEGLYAHYKAVIQSAPGFPVVLYNNPDRTCVQLPLEVIERLTDEFEEVVGLKQADPNQLIESCRRLMHKIPVWSRGEFDLLTVLALGAPGSISFSGNIIAPQLVQIVRLWEDGKISEARQLFYKMLPVIQACHWGPIPSTIKYMMRRTGWDVGLPRLPILDVSEAMARKLDAALAEAGVI